MSPSNTLDETKTTETPSTNDGESETTAPGEADNSSAATENKKEAMALTVQDPSAKSLSVKMHPDSSLPQSRPVTTSQLQISETFSAVGGKRPVFASSLQVRGTIDSSGLRPITAGNLVISEVYTSMGNRPVASNQIDDPDALMGYLD